MKLMRQTEIAISILIYCSRWPQQSHRTEDVAKAADTSKTHAAQIIKHLIRGRFLISLRGRSGGVMLAAPAKELRIGDIMARMQPDQTSQAVLRYNDDDAVGEDALRTVFENGRKHFLDFLNRYSVADLAMMQSGSGSAEWSFAHKPVPEELRINPSKDNVSSRACSSIG